MREPRPALPPRPLPAPPLGMLVAPGPQTCWDSGGCHGHLLPGQQLHVPAPALGCPDRAAQQVRATVTHRRTAQEPCPKTACSCPSWKVSGLRSRPRQGHRSRCQRPRPRPGDRHLQGSWAHVLALAPGAHLAKEEHFPVREVLPSHWVTFGKVLSLLGPAPSPARAARPLLPGP